MFGGSLPTANMSVCVRLQGSSWLVFMPTGELFVMFVVVVFLEFESIPLREPTLCALTAPLPVNINALSTGNDHESIANIVCSIR